MLYTQEIVEKISKDIEQQVKWLKTTWVKNTIVVSKEVIDRDGDIISIDWIDLKYYKKNPVVLADHSYTIESIVGKCTRITKKGDTLEADIEFADTPKGRLAQELRKGEFLKMSSIWFMNAERDPNDRKRIVKCEMIEFSMVAIGSNREALKLEGKEISEENYKKAIEYWIIKEVDKEEKKDEWCWCKWLQEIQKEMQEIKTLIKSLVDDKTMEEKEQELLWKKKVIQAIDSAFSEWLRLIKHL